MKNLLMVMLMIWAAAGVCEAQNVQYYTYVPVQQQIVTVPVVIYRPVVIYQPVPVVVPVVQQQLLIPFYPVPEIRRNCWNMFQPQQIRYYYYQ